MIQSPSLFPSTLVHISTDHRLETWPLGTTYAPEGKANLHAGKPRMETDPGLSTLMTRLE